MVGGIKAPTVFTDWINWGTKAPTIFMNGMDAGVKPPPMFKNGVVWMGWLGYQKCPSMLLLLCAYIEMYIYLYLYIYKKNITNFLMGFTI